MDLAGLFQTLMYPYGVCYTVSNMAMSVQCMKKAGTVMGILKIEWRTHCTGF